MRSAELSALARRNNPKGCVYHSDYESQYVSLPLSRTMCEHSVRPSMGLISSPWGKAAMESLMGIAKSECVHEAALDIFECIETAYNRARIHSALGSLNAESMPALFAFYRIEKHFVLHSQSRNEW